MAPTDTAAVSVTVNPVNDDPEALDDNASTDEDTPVTIHVLSNDDDVDGDSLEVTGVSNPPHGTAVIRPDDTIRYTPDANYNGSDSFTYTVSDGNGGTDTATVSVSVASDNDPPVADDENTTTDEDTAVTISVCRRGPYTRPRHFAPFSCPVCGDAGRRFASTWIR